jgi:hypothetical protein
MNIFLFILIFQTYAYTHCSEPVTATQLSYALVDKNSQPTIPLLQFCEKTQCFHHNNLPSIAASVATLLRPIGKERWENQTQTLPDAEDLRLFKELYLIQEIIPTQKSYDYAILFGGVLHDVRTRLAYLIGLWNKGISFNSLIILTGQRPLDQHIESKGLLSHNVVNRQLPTTEPEMIKFVFEQTDIPAELKKLPYIFVNAPIQQMQDGSFRRPNTEDTVIEWLRKHKPRPGSILAVSNQPFVGYQDAVLRKNLPPNFFGETVGPVYKNNESIATMHDTIARWIYNENLIVHNQRAKY